jgi:hypothetical protein
LLPQPTDWQITAKIFLVAPSYLGGTAMDEESAKAVQEVAKTTGKVVTKKKCLN